MESCCLFYRSDRAALTSQRDSRLLGVLIKAELFSKPLSAATTFPGSIMQSHNTDPVAGQWPPRNRMHEWPETIADALAIERRLAERVVVGPDRETPASIAGIETAYGTGATRIYASAVLLRYPSLEEIGRSSAWKEVVFPYVPGLFYFREGPAVLEALANLPSRPDVVLVHGHGRSHMRRCGMASMIGVVMDLCTIGCSRRLLAGRHRPVATARGSCQSIRIERETVGYALRTKEGVKPLYISAGHRCDLSDARRLVWQSLTGYRLPEPMRLAHLLANKYKRHMEDRKYPDHHSER